MPLNEFDEVIDHLVKSDQLAVEKPDSYNQILNDEVNAQKQSLQSTLSVAQAKDPNRQAEVTKIANQKQLPYEVVDRNLDSFKTEKKTFNYDEMIANSPSLSSWLEDYKNASVSHDDIDNLQNLESKTKEYSTLSKLYDSMNSGLASMWANTARIPGALYAAAALPQNIIAEQLFPEHPEYQAKVPKWLMDNPVSTYYDKQAEAFKVQEMNLSAVDQLSKGNYQKAGMALATQFMANLPNQALLVASAMAGVPGLGLAAAGGTTAAQSLKETQNLEGVPESAKTISALSKGSIEVLFENFGTFGVLKSWESAIAKQYGKDISRKVIMDFGKTMAYSMAGNANEEFLTSAAQDLTDYVTGTNPEALTGMWQRAADAGIAGGISGAGLSAVGVAPAVMQRQQQIRQAIMTRDYFLSLGKSAESTQLRNRLPEAQKNLVEKIAKDNDIEHVYIPTEAFDEYFQSKQLDPAKVMQETGTLNAYNEAKQFGTDIKIPLADFAHNFVGTEHYANLANDIKFDPSGITANEAKKFSEELKTKISEVDKATPITPEDPKEASSKKVMEEVTRQLTEAGFSTDISSTYSQLYGDFFKTLAGRENIDPLELFNQYNLKITRPELQTTKEGEIVQPSPEEQIAAQNQDKVFEQAKIVQDKIANILPFKGQQVSVEATPQITFSKKIQEKMSPDASQKLNELADRFSDNKEIVKRIKNTQDEKGPVYLSKKGVDHNYNWLPNFISQPTGIIGESGIAQPNSEFGIQEQLPWSDIKYKATLELIREHQVRKMPLTINTSSDVVGRDDYIAAMPQDTTVNIHLLTGNADLDRKLFPGNPSQKRLIKAGERLQERGIKVNYIIPKAQDILDIFGPQKIKEMAKKEGLKLNLNYLEKEILNGEKPLTTIEGEGKKTKKKTKAPKLQVVTTPEEAIKERVDFLKQFEEKKNLTSEDVQSINDYVDQVHQDMNKSNEIDSEKELNRAADILDSFQRQSKIKASGFSLVGQELNQAPVSFNQDEETARGKIKFGKQGINIELLKNADLSTFLHETGHFYLEVLGDIAEMEGASEQSKKDYKTLLDWLGVESRDQIKVEHHEKMARGFEAYLYEGKAPSQNLKDAFNRFRTWLVQVYKSITKLDVKLSNDVKDVFNRMLATDEEIKMAEQDQGYKPLFSDPQVIGLSKDQAEKYKAALDSARNEAEEILLTKMMADMQKKQMAQYKEERSKIREEIEQEVSMRKEYIAIEALQGKEFMEGVKLSKLSKEAIIKDYGKDILNKLPKPYIYSAKEGIHPDAAAEMFGYSSGQEMLESFTKVPPKEELIDRITDERMAEIHGDLLNDPKLGEQALKAVHNEKKSQLLRLELQLLAEGNFPAFKGLVRRISKKIPKIDMVRKQAQDFIKTKKYTEISPIVYQRAERKHAQEAVNAFLRGDLEAAFNAKEKELMNHELYRASIEAVDTVDDFVIYVTKFAKKETRQKLGKAGPQYLDQIDAIMERFDFKRSVSAKALDKRQSFRQWYESEKALGNIPFVSDRLLDENYRTSYKEISYEELLGLKDTVKNIEHLAKVKNELLAAQDKRSFEEVRTELIATAYANHEVKSEPVDYAPNFMSRIKTRATGFFAEHVRPEFFFEYMDGNKQRGPFWERFFNPFNRAQDEKGKMCKEINEGLTKIFEAYSPKERAEWFNKKTFIAEINNSMTKANAIAIALNMGNQYNKEALLAGEQWSEQQLNIVLDTMLDAKDWKMVQETWDLIDTLWPYVEKLEKDVTGISPPKVEATPVVNKHGVFKGGYYPIIFDAKRSIRTQNLNAASDVADLFGNNIARSMTRHGHTEARTNTGGRPLRLDMNGLVEHLTAVIHDITHRKAVIDANKLIHDKEIQDVIIRTAGKEMFNQLKPWLNNIAGDNGKQPSSEFQRFLGNMRTNSTIVVLGIKINSALSQILGIFNTVDQIGSKYAFKGVAQFLRDPRKFDENWKFITSRSQMMSERRINYDRDVKAAAKNLQITPQGSGFSSMADYYTQSIKESFFFVTSAMDLAVSSTTWLGAYTKAMEGEVEGLEKGNENHAVEYADKIVRMTQSAGDSKDLANIQGHNEAMKLFTMFYSQVSLQFNMLNRAKNQYKFDKDMKKLVSSLFLCWFLPAVFEDIIKGRGPSGEDEPEDIALEELGNVVKYPFGLVIGVRDIVSGISYGGKYNPSPAFDAIKSLTQTLALAKDLATGEKGEATVKDMRGAFDTLGYMFGFPSKQLWQSGEYFYEWSTGQQQPDGPIEGLYRGLIAGKKRK